MGAQEVLTVALGILLLVLVIVSTSMVRRRYQAFTAFSLASYCYAFVYGIVPVYYTLYPESAPDKISNAFHIDPQYTVLLIAIAGYLVIICGYSFGQRRKAKIEKIKDKEIPLQRYGSWAFLAFIFGMFGVWVEITLQGGIINAVRNIELIRSFGDSSVKDGIHNPLVFFRMFKPLVYFSFYLYYMLARETKFPWYKFMSLLTFVVTAYCIFINGGRTHIFILLATIMVGYFCKIGSNKKTLFFTLIVGITSLTLLDPLFSYLTFNKPFELDSSLSFDYIVEQFNFPYSNMIFVTSHDFSFRYFQDAGVWIISIMPSFFLNKIGIHEQPPLYEYNTVLQNNTMLLGGLPDDILTFGYYQFGFTGILLTVFVFGYLLSRLDNIVMSLKENTALRPIVARVMIYIAMMVMYADLESMFIVRYDVILLMLFLVNYRKYKLTVLQLVTSKQKVSHSTTIAPLPQVRHQRAGL